jgi:hypothetical protein
MHYRCLSRKWLRKYIRIHENEASYLGFCIERIHDLYEGLVIVRKVMSARLR